MSHRETLGQVGGATAPREEVGQVGGAAGRGGRCARVRAPPTVARISRRRTSCSPRARLVRRLQPPRFSPGFPMRGRRRGRPGPAETCRRRPGAAALGQKCHHPAVPCYGLAWSWVLSVPPADPRRQATPQVRPSSPLRGSVSPSLATSLLNSLAPSLLPFRPCFLPSLIRTIASPLPPALPPCSFSPSFPPSLIQA